MNKLEAAIFLGACCLVVGTLTGLLLYLTSSVLNRKFSQNIADRFAALTAALDSQLNAHSLAGELSMVKERLHQAEITHAYRERKALNQLLLTAVEMRTAWEKSGAGGGSSPPPFGPEVASFLSSLRSCETAALEAALNRKKT